MGTISRCLMEKDGDVRFCAPTINVHELFKGHTTLYTGHAIKMQHNQNMEVNL